MPAPARHRAPRRGQPTAKARPPGRSRGAGSRSPALTLHAAAAGLQDPGVHIRPRLGHELVAHEVGVVRRGDEVVAQRPCHVLVHAVVLRVEDVTSGAPRVVGEACGEECGGATRGLDPVYQSRTGLILRPPTLKACGPLGTPLAWQHSQGGTHSPSMPIAPLLLFSGQGSNCSMMSRQLSRVTPVI